VLWLHWLVGNKGRPYFVERRVKTIKGSRGISLSLSHTHTHCSHTSASPANLHNPQNLIIRLFFLAIPASIHISLRPPRTGLGDTVKYGVGADDCQQTPFNCPLVSDVGERTGLPVADVFRVLLD